MTDTSVEGRCSTSRAGVEVRSCGLSSCAVDGGRFDRRGVSAPPIKYPSRGSHLRFVGGGVHSSGLISSCLAGHPRCVSKATSISRGYRTRTGRRATPSERQAAGGTMDVLGRSSRPFGGRSRVVARRRCGSPVTMRPSGRCDALAGGSSVRMFVAVKPFFRVDSGRGAAVRGPMVRRCGATAG
jgi:hypothetical protein